MASNQEGLPFSEYLPSASGLSAGTESDEVTKLQRYLTTYGYLDSPMLDTFGVPRARAAAPSPQEGAFDDNTVRALRRFQEFNGLESTGELDDASLELMGNSRCGFVDVAEFVLQGNKWNKTALTYGFAGFTPDLTSNQVRAAVTQAFGLWSAVSPLTFAEIPFADGPDIKISFAIGAHGDGDPFDGSGGTLAHAYYPPPNGGDIAGDTHIDDAETWSVNVPPSGIDLTTVCAHEFGHALGLAHSGTNDALMFAFYSGPHRSLHEDDINGIQALYGKPNGCFIATAAYGSDLAPEVQLLRELRDNVLRQTRWGRDFFETYWKHYYRISPPIAEEMVRNPELRSVIRWSIVSPWANYMKLLAGQPNWEDIDVNGLNPDLRNFLGTLRTDMEKWLSEVELPRSFADHDPKEAVCELNVILRLALTSQSQREQYLDELIASGGLPLSYEAHEEEELTNTLREAGRSEKEIECVLTGQRISL